jgi:hypothetical protein
MVPQRIRSPLAVSLAAACALAAASAAPAGAKVRFKLSHSPANAVTSSTGVQYRLEISGDNDAHVLHVQGGGGLTEQGPFVAGASGFSSVTYRGCRSKWRFNHTAPSSDFGVTIALPPKGDTYLVATQRFVSAPWPGESLAQRFTITEDGGEWTPISPLVLDDNGPKVEVPLGVQFSWDAALAGRQAVQEQIPVVSKRKTLVVSGVASPLPAGERIELDWLPPGAKSLRDLATVKVRGGSRFSYKVKLPKAGRYEFVARRRAGGAFADDASPCGLVVQAR